MTVYVDTLRQWSGVTWRGGRSCHLLADTVEELHRFAASIGCRPEWYQPKSTPHYDIGPRLRRKALASGAVEAGKRKIVELIRKHRTTEAE